MVPNAILMCFVSAVTLAAAECQANNCVRAVTGSSQGQATVAAHRADCSSFLSITVTPAVSTVYQTITIAPSTATTTVTTVTQRTTLIVNTATDVVTTTIGGGLFKRAVTTAVTQSPTRVPPYASPCSNAAQYSSACSCWGVTRRTTTAPTPLTTVTRTATAFPTVSTSALTTLTVSATTTTATTATMSLPPVCTPESFESEQGQFTCGCTYDIICYQRVPSNSDSVDMGSMSLRSCTVWCDIGTNCQSFSWRREDGSCLLNTRDGFNTIPDIDYETGFRRPGPCPIDQCID